MAMREVFSRLRRLVGQRPRAVEPEWLDVLPATDPRAVRSRRDLQRVNAWMGNAGLLSSLLERPHVNRPPRTVAEVGSGDGSLMLQIAKRFASVWTGVSLEFVDRQDLLAEETSAQFKAVGWGARGIKADVFDWLDRPGEVDLLVANLFLHHFEDRKLAELLRRVTRKARVMAACEPRRFRFPALAGSCVLLLGCNAVTRHDAVASVRAGFAGREISALWPDRAGWELHEADAFPCSHIFRATRV